ncbi:hypothetical protein IWW39_004088 [Coemansia spiralis]|uniref:t-SNARE coiled-coil homology domain-containing protein n=2 Tax=Coemansia TaxID=4863 RepID=A0A9W8GHT2_9FUNG|nr:hypothetical protein IWW39_004088 [Coemansia spiralis]
MDITSDFKGLVRRHVSTQQAQLPAGKKSIKRVDVLPPKRANLAQPTGNLFLAEAYIIAKHLYGLRARIIDIRPAYLNLQTRHKQAVSRQAGKQGMGRLASVRLTDPERDEIDRGIKTAVRQMLSKIQSLNELGEAELESVEDNVNAGVLLKRLVGALDPRKAGGHGAESETRPELTLMGRRDTLAAHQSSIVWWLNSTLQKANKVHAEMQELHLRQKLERQRGLLSRAQPAASSSGERLGGAENDEVLQHLSEQELQQLQMENKNMVQEFESALDTIRETQRSILEISTLQSQLATEMDAQMQQTERLYNDAVGALDAVGQGNEHLVSARKHQSSARKWVLIILFVLSLVLLFLDWFD